MTQWIPVSKGLPDNNCDVLVVFDWNMAVGHLEGDEWLINSGDSWVTPVLEGEREPIAWMHLPESYKENM